MSDTTYRQVLADGLWRNNTGLVQLLGLCPLLATSNSIINALGLGLATTAVLIASNGTISAIRHIVPKEIRLPVFVLVIAAFVTVVDLLMHAYLYDLWKVLGIFVPLIVTNCVIIGRAEAFASRQNVSLSITDGLAMGLGFTAVLVVLGGMRELVGTGALFANADLMLGDWAGSLYTVVFEDYRSFLIAILPPGAFFGLGLLVAGKNMIDARSRRKQVRAAVSAMPAEA